MPKRTDLHKILVIGAGPIVIGQGCEFDYSGSQAVKALKEEGYEVVLVNSNLFSTFCLVEHIHGIVDIPLQYINETRVLFQFS